MGPTLQGLGSQAKGAPRAIILYQEPAVTRFFSAKSRIAIGLVSILASAILIATVLGIVPDRRTAVMDGRAKLCETIAVISSILVTNGELRRRRKRTRPRSPRVGPC